MFEGFHREVRALGSAEIRRYVCSNRPGFLLKLAFKQDLIGCGELHFDMLLRRSAAEFIEQTRLFHI